MAAHTPHEILEAEGIYPRPRARRKIYAFEDAAGDRIGRAIPRLKAIPGGATLAEALARCRDRGSPCPIPCLAGRICDHRSVHLSRGGKASFSDTAYARPGLSPWRFFVAMPTGLQLEEGQLHQLNAYKVIRSLAQRFRRANLHALIALDICLVEAIGIRGVFVRTYWAPHYNVLLPAAELERAKDALQSLCPKTDFIPVPLLSRSVDDPWIAANYAAKFDLSAVRLRRQHQHEDGGDFLLDKRHFRLSSAAFTEFLAWRSTFDPKFLVTSVGLRVG